MSSEVRYVVLQEMEDESPDVFRKFYPSVADAKTAIREQWLTPENIAEQNAHIVNEWGLGMEIALGDNDYPCLTLTILEISP